jgi:hypothetical protein
MRRLRIAFSLTCVGLATACVGTTPERIELGHITWVGEPGAGALEFEQRLRLSATMLDALANGIPLRLVYGASGCVGGAEWRVNYSLELSYSPLRRVWETRSSSGELRAFARRHQMLAALDRVRMPIGTEPPVECRGEVMAALDLTALPPPLRFPALLRPQEWRLVSESMPWIRPRA